MSGFNPRDRVRKILEPLVEEFAQAVEADLELFAPSGDLIGMADDDRWESAHFDGVWSAVKARLGQESAPYLSYLLAAAIRAGDVKMRAMLSEFRREGDYYTHDLDAEMAVVDVRGTGETDGSYVDLGVTFCPPLADKRPATTEVAFEIYLGGPNAP